MVDELQQKVVIPLSNSHNVRPAFLVPKVDGKSCLVIDYRKLNSKILIDVVPLPDLRKTCRSELPKITIKIDPRDFKTKVYEQS